MPTQISSQLSEDADGNRRRLYGRSRGHRLRPGQSRLIQSRLPELSIDVCATESDLLAPLADLSEIWLEIGFGSGEHLIGQARARPDVGFVGCEFFLNGVAKLVADIDAYSLDNIRIHMGDARDLLDRLPQAVFGRIFILFPDPWPKNRHHKRRLINTSMLARLAQLLKPGGELRIATDIDDYCRWILAEIAVNGAFDWHAERPADWRQRPADWPETRYEQKAVAAGRRPSYLTFIRRPA